MSGRPRCPTRGANARRPGSGRPGLAARLPLRAGTRGTSLAAQLDARLDTEKQDTLLTWAARHGQAEAVRLLLEGGASVGATTAAALPRCSSRARRATSSAPGCSSRLARRSTKPLRRRHAAVRRVPAGPPRVRPAAPRGWRGGQPSRDDGATPLYIACQKGHLECARLLLEAGAAVNQAEKTAPRRCSSRARRATSSAPGCSSRLARRSTKPGERRHAAVHRVPEGPPRDRPAAPRGWRGGQPSRRRRRHAAVHRVPEGPPRVRPAAPRGWRGGQPSRDDGATPLFIACQEGHLECARLLLEAGAAVNQASDDGATPLFVACHEGHLEVAKLLSSYGASRAATPFGTPEEVANREGHADLAAWLVASRGWTPLQHLEACPRLAAEGVSALSSRPLPLFRRRSPSTGRGRCCAAARTLQPASLLPSSGRASSARGASRIRPLRPSVPQSRSTLSSRGPR